MRPHLQRHAEHRLQRRHLVHHHVARAAQPIQSSMLAAHVTPYDSATRGMLSQAQAMLMRNGTDPVTANRQATALLYGAVQQQARC